MATATIGTRSLTVLSFISLHLFSKNRAGSTKWEQDLSRCSDGRKDQDISEPVVSRVRADKFSVRAQ
mgnify:CR=1 FL=1